MDKMRQSLQQKLQQKLSPQQIQVIRLLELPLQQLEQRIKQELEENPTLEEGAPSEDLSDREQGAHEAEERETQEADDQQEKEEFSLEDYLNEEDEMPAYTYTTSSGHSQDSTLPTPDQRYAEASSFRDSLLEQIRFRRVDATTSALAEYIVGSLDSDGYLRRPLQTLADDILLTQGELIPVEQLEEALKLVQTLEPKGIGATSLKECLLLQLRDRKDQGAAFAIKLLNQCFDEFIRKHYEKIQEKCDFSEEELKEAIDEILKLNPKPGDMAEPTHLEATTVIIPDFLLGIDENTGELSVSLNSRNTPELRISRNYTNLLTEFATNRNKATKEEKDAAAFVRKKIDSARWFIESIRQRNETMLAVMGTIAHYQSDYFHSGDITDLKPMILKDIAEPTNLDISTISRVVSSKHVQTPFGIYPLRAFFSEGMQNLEGEEISTKEIKKALRDIVDAEDKSAPLTDDQLRVALKERGYSVARRTIAKYREQQRIPVARLRKQL